MACEANSSMENKQPSEGRRIDADLQAPCGQFCSA